MSKKILVWLSGWVDSAVSAYLLKKAGYDITAWFMINYLDPEWKHCHTFEDMKIAKEVATYLNIPFFTFDYRKEYEEKVLNYMYSGYKKWITPNPDIMCNSEIKFKVFLDEALHYWFDLVATWHYAQIIKTNTTSFIYQLNWINNELFLLKKWIDQNKDQSYFLAWLSEFQLSKSIFPIWHLTKTQVRKIAEEAWLPNKNRKDSQWICFIWKINLYKFLEKKIDHKPWKIIDTSWKILWVHNWIFYYTIWQRKWLNIWGLTEPVFVVKKDIENNILIVGTSKDINLYNNELIIKYTNILLKSLKFPLKAKAKIRYRQEDQDCEVNDLWDWKFKIKFEKLQRAITSWQICAIYDKNDFLIMSWVIE